MRDRDVRLAVRTWLEALHAGDADTRLVEEMGVWSGSVRIDMAVINGELTGIELKSDSDTLSRLPLQAQLYSKVFDKVIIVVGLKHAAKAFDKVPDWWGFITASIASGDISLKTEREPKTNPCQEPYLLAQLLWKDEALEALKNLGLDKGCRSKSAKFFHQKLASEVPIEDLGFQVRTLLKKRKIWLRKNMSH